MKIVMFQYNKEASAIIRDTAIATASPKKRLVANQFLVNGYTDRLLWEEAASLRPKKPEFYPIPGNWQ